MYLRHRNGKWYYTINAKDDYGRVQKHEYFGGYTRQEAAKAYRAAMVNVDRTGRYFDPSTLKLVEYLPEWLEKGIGPNVKPATLQNYEALCRNHLCKDLGAMSLRDLTTPLLQDYFTKKMERYSRSTVRLLHTILNEALQWATANRRYLAYSPMIGVRLPRGQELPSRPAIFSVQDIQAIVNRFPPGDAVYLPCAIAYNTGLRLGECLALQWGDIDLRNDVIHVRHTLRDRSGVPELQEMPKTTSSIRVVTFTRHLHAIFENQKLRQSKRRFEYGPHYLADPEHDYVCTRPDGRVVTSNSMRVFNLWCKKNCPGHSFHSFRHTHATRLIEAGLPLDYVSKRLGHASITTTANIYDRITDKREKAALDVMERVL